MGEKEAFSALTSFQENVWINLVIMLLIIIGGVGFFTLYDVIKYTYHFPKYSLQTKAILPITMALLSIPAFYLYIVEFSQPSWNGLGMKEKILAAAFQSVTTRTAGFNTVNLGNMCEASLLILIILMLIGGSPGSTAGGFKTTTLGVLAAGCIAVFKQKSDVNLCGRRVDDDAVRCAATIFVSYLFFFLTGSILISISEGVPVLPAMFEAASAIGTVGLSLGITPGIGCMARVVLIFLMFFGRAGALTLVFCAIPRKANTFSRLPHEKIMVG